ncbi:hypothetical protein [Bremerella cremea]|uniref:hypothetical protein n=1 Tax=Bremerella cremea TaxID=1031537 RepID=UPI0011C08274|nr:hypothetical protein [Bremerella cremea]
MKQETAAEKKKPEDASRASLSQAGLSKSKVLPTPSPEKPGKKSSGKGSRTSNKGAPPKSAPPAERPKWAGEPVSSAPKGPDPARIEVLHKIPPGKESPILRSRRKLASVILPGDRHVPALEVPWGAPCNPPKDFLKEQAGTMTRAEATVPPQTEHMPLLAPEEKEIRIEPSGPAEDAPLVDSVIVEGPRSPEKPAAGDDDDSLLAGVMEESNTPSSKKQDVGFHRSAAEPVIKGTFGEETVTSDNDGGFYRPALPGQHEDIYDHDPKTLEKALAGAQAALGRTASIDEMEMVEGSKYVSQIRRILSDEEDFGKSSGSSFSFQGLPNKTVMTVVGVVSGVVFLIIFVVAISTVSSMLGGGLGGGGNPYGYVTQTTSDFPVEARGPAGLVTVKFPTNFDEIPTIERPWLDTKVNGERLVRKNDTFVMMYSSSIPGKTPGPKQMPTKEQLEVFGLQDFFGGNDHLTKTDHLMLDDYPLIEYHFNADILRGQAGKSRVAFLYTQQRIFVFLWSGSYASSEVKAFFQSINVKGHHYPGSG